MRILITGSTGSIGKGLFKLLFEKRYDIAFLVRSESYISAFTTEVLQEVRVINIQDQGWAEQVKSFNPEVVVHLAAFLTSSDDFKVIPDLINSNITFGTLLLQALKETSLKLFINTGTFAEYQLGNGEVNPAYLYSATKSAFRSIIHYYQQLSGFKVVNVIPYTVYGQQDSQPKLIDIIYKSFYSENLINTSLGKQKLDMVHIDDVLKFYYLIINQDFGTSRDWETYHLGTGAGVSPRDVCKIMQNLLGRTSNIKWGALPYRPRDTMHSVAPIAKIIKDFKWQPEISIEEGISKYIEQASTIK